MRTPRYVGCFSSLRGRFLPTATTAPSSPELGEDAFRELELVVVLPLQVQLSSLET
jgi:hypothetical protein